MANMYYDDDADLSLLDGRKIAIIGYGIQGGAQSLCLRDSGCDVVVAELEGTPNYERAVAEDWEPMSAEDAAAQAQIIQILTQDHVQAAVYKGAIEPNLAEAMRSCSRMASTFTSGRSCRRRPWTSS